MTFEQIIRELRGVEPRRIQEWLDLRRDPIAALSTTERACLTDAVDDLRRWLRKLALLTAK